MEQAKAMYVQIILPVPLHKLFTYKIPDTFLNQVHPGMRVVVSFGKKRILTGIVHSEITEVENASSYKEIIDVLDEVPILTSIQLKFIDWLSSYYMAAYGDVIQAMLPSGFRLSSESIIELNPLFDEQQFILTANESKLIAHLRSKSYTFAEVEKLLSLPRITTLLNQLLKKEAIVVYEQIKEKYTPKKVAWIKLHDSLSDKEILKSTIQQLERAPKQLDVLLSFLKLPEDKRVVEKHFLVEQGFTSSILQALVKKQLLVEEEKIISRIRFENAPIQARPTLSEEQSDALKRIHEHFETKNTCLLQGITGSGKTELYIHIIQQTIESGSTALLLLPEIALTTQIVQRLEYFFGKRMAVYHSKFSDNERVEVWNAVKSGEIDFVVGVRSSIFLPFHSLGLIIIDEEHESSYKQQDPAPRYHARDAALVLAQMHNCKTLLGSATPSLESYYNAQQGTFGYVGLFKRFGDGKLPNIQLADLKLERKNKTIVEGMSTVLVEAIKQTLQKNKQVILFQNRRGFAPVIECATCEEVLTCKNCSVSLTYHQFRNELRCHYCGYTISMPSKCPSCTSNQLITIGAGTEKIEESLKLLIPEARVARMDLDTTRRKNAFQELFDQFSNHEIDILVGTQMLTKGLNFGNVELVGVFDADTMLHFPNFRAIEKSFQTMMQVSGRAGRQSDQGQVIIQTYSVNHPIFQYILTNNYTQFYDRELGDRKQYHYPPYTRIIHLSILHPEKSEAQNMANELSFLLKQQIEPTNLLGPQLASIEKLRNLFHVELYVKMERQQKNSSQIKWYIQRCMDRVLTNKSYNKGKIIVDIDAY